MHRSRDAKMAGIQWDNETLAQQRLAASHDANVSMLKSIFQDVDPMQYRDIVNGEHRFCLVYFDGVVDKKIIDDHIIAPLMLTDKMKAGVEPLDVLKASVLPVNGIKLIDRLDEIVQGLTYGDSLLLVDDEEKAMFIDTKSFMIRAIDEPDAEKILSGPREGFTEALQTNLSMLRRKLRTQDLKMKYYNLGERSNTQICVAYIDSLVEGGVLDELYRRLGEIHIDSVLDANYIAELIKDNAWSVFRTTGFTERPDVVAAKILEGRVAVFVDGTPVVLTLPYLFVENFQSNEDYYVSYYYTSFSRMLRMLGFFMAVAVPGLYVAIVAYHHEMLPTTLLINIAIDSHVVPLPAALEALVMMIMFDILRETGIRMPAGVGQAFSIVGALVLGQASVEANLVSAPMIIVIAASGITSLLVPNMNAPVIFLRLTLLFLSSVLGFYGLTLGLGVLLIHVLSLKSFGISQLARDERFSWQQQKDTLIRAPWWRMIEYPRLLAKDKRRQNDRRRNR